MALLPPPAIRRLTQLLAGLVLYGAADALIVRAGLGLAPWDVLHQGLERTVGLSIGAWLLIVGAAVLLLWIPLRQRPGVGTVLNGLVIGGVLDATLRVLPTPSATPVRAAFLAAGVVLTGVATGAYIGAGLGPGPRDGLMTGLAARGHSLRVVRTGLELTVLATGWALGGTVGIGTVAFALAIGPLAHVFLPRLTITTPATGPAATGAAGRAEEGAPAAGHGAATPLPSEAGA